MNLIFKMKVPKGQIRVISSYLWYERVCVGDLGDLEPVLDALRRVRLPVAGQYRVVQQVRVELRKGFILVMSRVNI